ncbi:V-type ATP synthase subunit E [Halobacteriales archaeon QS_8_69_73]|nr:MAG: V-type ATP synthase subunit E [Halobacteriales archaeon QS_8_69_73]
MSLETVVEDIREEARARAEEIRTDGESRAEEIVADAEADAERIHREAREEAERRIEQEREQELSGAKLEGDEREELTRTLLAAAAEEFPAEETVRVHGHEDDADLLETVVGDFEGYAVGDSVDCLGGVAVESDESRVRVNNTFDSVLEDVWEENLREISTRLFEE